MKSFQSCPYPWTTLFIYPEMDGCAGPCCHFAPVGPDVWSLDLSRPEAIDEVWQSQRMKELRRSISLDQRTESRCINCQTLHLQAWHFTPAFETMRGWIHLTDVQRQNLDSAWKSYKERSAYVSYSPPSLVFRFGNDCNIHCIMCNHEVMRKEYHTRELTFAYMKSIKHYLTRACVVSVTGGDPLHLKNARAFLDWFCEDDDFLPVTLNLCTNAFALDKILPKLAHRRVTLQVSLDGVGDRYNRIRRGSSWERVSSNLDAFFTQKTDFKVPRDSHRVYCTITRTGLPSLPDLVRWSTSRGLRMNFTPMKILGGKAPQESLFEIPELLIKVPDWDKLFVDALELLSGDEYGYERTQLGIIYNDLKVRAQKIVDEALQKCVSQTPQIQELQAANELREKLALLEAENARLETCAQLFKTRATNLAASRWRRLGLKLGIAKKLEFE